MSFVLIHGAGFGANCWDELIPHLDTEALAVDLPGRGTRADVSLRAITLADCADAVREDVEARSASAAGVPPVTSPDLTSPQYLRSNSLTTLD
jgi:pimeloyl-ACP methyl ester carboxylesterase